MVAFVNFFLINERESSCHTSDSKSQSHRCWWGSSRTIQSRRRDSTG